MAGGSFGGVLGVAVGGALAARFGWRWSFAVMAIIGLVLAGLYRLVVQERRLATEPGSRPEPRQLAILFRSPTLICAYVASGLQLFVAAAFYTWLPSYLNRVYHLAAGRAAGVAALNIAAMGIGMIVCGLLTDRMSRGRPVRAWTTSLGYALAALALVGGGFALPPGPAQLVLLAAGAFFVAGTAGPVGAVVTNLTSQSVRATALGTLTVANNLLGLAVGPVLTGVLADHIGLARTMRVVPLVSAVAIVFLIAGRRLVLDRAAVDDDRLAGHEAGAG
jgi:predicted MFS family arabinose efflux permease